MIKIIFKALAIVGCASYLVLLIAVTCTLGAEISTYFEIKSVECGVSDETTVRYY